MERKWKFAPGPSPFSNSDAAYQESSPGTHSLADISLQSDFRDSEKVASTGTVNGSPEDDWAHGLFDNLPQNDLLPSNTFNIHRNLDFIEDLSTSRQGAKSTSVIKNENEVSHLVVSSIADANRGSQLFHFYSQELAPGSIDLETKKDTRGSIIKFFRELKDSPLIYDDSVDIKTNIRQNSSIQSSLDPPFEDSQISQTHETQRDFKENNDKKYNENNSPSEFVGDDATESSARSSTCVEYEYQAMQRENPNDHSMKYYRGTMRSSFPQLHGTKSTRNSIDSRGYLIRRAKSSILKRIQNPVKSFSDWVFKLPIPEYSQENELLPYQRPYPANAGRRPNEHLFNLKVYFKWLKSSWTTTWDAELTAMHRPRPPRFPAKSRKTVFHRGPTPHKKLKLGQRRFLAKFLLKSHRVQKTRVRRQRKSRAESSNCEAFRYRNFRFKIILLSRARLSTFTNNRFNSNSIFWSLPSFNSKSKVDFHNYSPVDWVAHNHGDVAEEYISSRRTANEPILDRARGITDSDKPDSFKRLFSTIRVQSDTPEQRIARKRRRREIIQDDGSDDDLGAVGEPRKLLRLHDKELADKAKAWEPITEDRVRDLVSIGRSTGYASILGKDIMEVEMIETEPLNIEGPYSDEMDIDEPRDKSRAIYSKDRAAMPPPMLRSSREKPMNMNGGAPMIRNGGESKRSPMKKPALKISISDMRQLQRRACVLYLRAKKDEKSMSEDLKRELKEIQDTVFSMEPPKTYDDRQRAARIIRGIEDCNVYVNGLANENTDISVWYDKIEYNPLPEFEDLDTASEQLRLIIRALPVGNEKREIALSRLSYVESRINMMENRETFYDDASCDNMEYDAGEDKHGDKFRHLSAGYRNAIDSWKFAPASVVDEQADIQRAINLSLSQGGNGEAMDQGSDDAVVLPSIEKGKDDTETEEEELQRAIAMSRNDEAMVGSHDAAALPSIKKWKDDTETEEEELQRAIAMSLAMSRGEDLQDEDYHMG